MQSQRSTVKNAALRDILMRIEGCRERLAGPNPLTEISVLRQIEKDLEKALRHANEADGEQAAALLLIWSVLSLAYKKESDYRLCLESLLRVRKLEVALNASQLDIAVTHANLGTCYHFLQESDLGLKHTTIAKDTLVQQVKLSQQNGQTGPPGYKKKLMLNLVLVYFNRGVQYYKLGDMNKFKLNLTQSLELATQKFGKEESITTLIKSLHDKEDKSSLKPFFINKSPDIGVYLNKGIGRRISLRDIDIRGNRRGKDSRDSSDRNEEENVTISRPRSSNRLPPINSRDISRETSQVGNREVLRSSGKGSINTGDPSKARQIEIRSSANQIPASSSLNKSSHEARDNNTGHRSVTKTGKNNPKPNESTADASVFGERNENQHLPNVYALSRIRVALKYMK